MTSYIGSSWAGSFVTSAGTVQLGGDYRTFDYNPTIDLLDETAGADTAKQKVPYMKDSTAKFSGLLQAGTSAGGTSMAALCVEGASGTLFWCPEGTAAGKPKYTQPAICLGSQFKYAYNNFTEISIAWEGNGPRVEGTAP
jgi:hypothetical protein